MRLLLSGALLAFAGVFLGVGTPAQAAPADVSPVFEASGEGEAPWGKPTFPVTCERMDVGGSQRHQCEPDDKSQRVADICFENVSYGDRLVFVCTAFAGNVDAIKAAGGEEMTVQFGCQFGDAWCLAQEKTARDLSSMISGQFAWAITNTGFNTDSYLWTTAMTEWGWWAGAALFVTLSAGMIAIVQALYSRDRAEAGRALLRLALAFPASLCSVWVIGTIVNAVDQMTEPILRRGNNGDGLYATVQNIIYGGGMGNITWGMTIIILLFLAAVVLVFVFSARNLALGALIALGPVAYMLFPHQIGVQWVVRWWSAVAALILTTPLTLGFLMYVMQGFGNVETMWSIQAMPLVIGMIMVAFAPFAVFTLFSFVGGQVAASAADAASSRPVERSQQSLGRIRNRYSQMSQRSRTLRSQRDSAAGGSGPRSTNQGSRPESAGPGRGGQSTSQGARSNTSTNTPNQPAAQSANVAANSKPSTAGRPSPRTSRREQ